MENETMIKSKSNVWGKEPIVVQTEQGHGNQELRIPFCNTIED